MVTFTRAQTKVIGLGETARIKRVNQPQHRKLASTLPYDMQTNATLQEILVHTDSLVTTIDALRCQLHELRPPTVAFTPPPVVKETDNKIWLSIGEYATIHGKAYSTVAGYKHKFGAGMTRQDPNHSGRWQIHIDAPYPISKS